VGSPGSGANYCPRLYPVIVRGQNYGGASPAITKEPILTDFVDHVLARELSMTPQTLVIALGRAACRRAAHRVGQVRTTTLSYGFSTSIGVDAFL